MALRLWTSAPAVYSGKAGFGKRPALLLIDFVEGYFDKTCDLYSGVDDALASALRVREAARPAGVPVVLTNVVHHPMALNGGRFCEKATPLRNFLQGSPMGAWPKGLVPEPDELVVSKQYPSAFFGASLVRRRGERGRDHRTPGDPQGLTRRRVDTR